MSYVRKQDRPTVEAVGRSEPTEDNPSGDAMKKSPHPKPILQQDPNATPEDVAKALLRRVTPYVVPRKSTKAN